MTQWKSLLVCALLLVAAVPESLAQGPARGPAPNPPTPSHPPPQAAPSTPLSPPARAPGGAPPTVSAVSPPGKAPPTSAPPARAPGTAPTTGVAGAAVGTPARGPTVGPSAATTAKAPVASAPGPLSSGTVNATVSLVSAGSLSQSQQQQLCSAVVNGLKSNFSGIQQCTVTSQTTSSQPGFATTGRRLRQTSSTIILGLALSTASVEQTAGIQQALNNLIISVGSTSTQITAISVTFVTININVAAPTAPVPGPTLPSSTTIALAPAGNTTLATVVTAVPPSATGNTTQNVPASQAVAPAAPSGGTSTVTTIKNSTHTTTTTTIAIFSITTQTTTITQYFFTVIIGQTTGTFTILSFGLPGNVANNLPVIITGGAVTGSTKTVTVTGSTVSIITSTTITTSTATTTQTSTTTSTGQSTTATTGTGTGSTNGTGTTTTTGINPGITAQVCKVPNNPYGAIQNQANEGTLVKGAFLVSSWNDLTANMNPGQGNLIYQCMPNGTSTVWANVTISGACKKDQAGVGVTMALSRCGSVIIVGSLPIVPGNAPSPGCLIALDLTGKTVNEVTSPGINGPWGSVCSTSGNQITYALSSVLGGLSNSSANSTGSGRRLAQAPSSSSAPTGGFVVRWTFTTPTSGSPWTLGTPTFLVSGIQTNGSAVAGGNVGPGGLTVDNAGTLYVPDNLGNQIFAIPNGLTTSNAQATPLTLTPNNRSAMATNGPNSVTWGAGNVLLGTNTQDANLFFISLNSASNGGTSSLLLTDPANPPGVLFQAIFSTDASAGAPIGSVWYQNDGTNTFNTVTNLSGVGLPPASAPQSSTARPSGGPSTG